MIVAMPYIEISKCFLRHTTGKCVKYICDSLHTLKEGNKRGRRGEERGNNHEARYGKQLVNLTTTNMLNKNGGARP